LARLDETPQLKLEAASRRLPRGAVFSGFTAAWLHGLDVEPCDPIEVTVPSPARISTRAGLVVRRRALDRDEVVTRRGLPATSMLRTIRDLCMRLSLTEAVAVADMALHSAKVERQDLVAAAAAPTAGVRMLRQVLEHAEPSAESPMETRLRMLLVLAGLPRPEAQVAIRDRLLRVIGRPDLYYRDERLGLEYDGGTHRDTLVEDNRRQNRLLDAGVRLLRFTAGDIFNTPDHVIGLVRAGLAA
jgi:very-short-patch-repair endonuclease